MAAAIAVADTDRMQCRMDTRCHDGGCSRERLDIWVLGAHGDGRVTVDFGAAEHLREVLPRRGGRHLLLTAEAGADGAGFSLMIDAEGDAVLSWGGDGVTRIGRCAPTTEGPGV